MQRWCVSLPTVILISSSIIHIPEMLIISHYHSTAECNHNTKYQLPQIHSFSGPDDFSFYTYHMNEMFSIFTFMSTVRHCTNTQWIKNYASTNKLRSSKQGSCHQLPFHYKIQSKIDKFKCLKMLKLHERVHGWSNYGIKLIRREGNLMPDKV